MKPIPVKLNLQLAAGRRHAGLRFRDDRPDRRHATSTWMTIKQVSKGERISETADRSLVDGMLHRAARKHRGKVEQGARHRGHRDAAGLRDFV
jgi:hypothetical protein